MGAIHLHEVHCPDIVWADCLWTVIAQFRFHPSLRGLVPELHPQLPVNTIDFLDLDAPEFAIQKNMDASVAIAHLRLADILDPFLNCGLIGASGLVMKRRAVKADGPTGVRIDTAQSSHIPRTSSRMRPGLRSFDG